MPFEVRSPAGRLARLAWIPALATGIALAAQSVAITLDDGPKLQATPLLSPEQRNGAILKHLQARGVPAMFFVTVNRGADRPQGLQLLRALSDGGQLLANHTVTHPDFNAAGTSVDGFAAEVEACDRVISAFAGLSPVSSASPTSGKAPARTSATPSGPRLRASGYRIGYVAIGHRRLAGRPEAVRTAGPGRPGRPGPPGAGSTWTTSGATPGLTGPWPARIYGRDVPLVLLLHHNLLNALFLGDVADLFRSRGWTLVSPDAAFDDPAYQVEPQVLPLDGSVLESSARALGIPARPFFEEVKDEARNGAEAGRL